MLVALASACELEPRPLSYVEATEIFTVRHTVEIGPLNPERVGPLIAGGDMPIAEVLPGDRLRLEIIVVDVDGRRVLADELDTLWVTCGRTECEWPVWGITFAQPPYNYRCDEFEESLTTDDICVLGSGVGAFEFEVPEFGPQVGLSGGLNGPGFSPLILHLFGVASWGHLSAEQCWAARRGDRAMLDGCGFVHYNVGIGPLWTAYARAVELGYETHLDFDLSMVPEFVFQQPANRIPKPPSVDVVVNGELLASAIPPLPAIAVEAGDHIDVTLHFDPLTQLFQSRFKPLRWNSFDAFTLEPEKLYATTATTGAIVETNSPGPVRKIETLQYAVDDFAGPGTSRVWIGYHDDRGANDWLVLEFEH